MQSYQSISGFIATVTHPFFKLRWHNEMQTPDSTEKIQSMLIKAANAISTPNDSLNNDVQPDVDGEKPKKYI